MTDRISTSQSSPSVSFYLEADVIQTDTANNRWLVRFRLRASKGSGSYYLNAGVQVAYANSSEVFRHSGNPFLPTGSTGWNYSYDIWINANSNGYWSGTSTSYPVQMHVGYGAVTYNGSGALPLPRIVQLPAAPSLVGVDQATTTSLRYQFSGGGDGGSAILEWQAQASTDATFATVDQTVVSNGTTTFTTLSPGNTHYFRARGRNSRGWGPWGAFGNGTTLPATPPIFSLLPTIAGNAANLTLAPPSGVATVDSYTVERRLVGGVATSIPMAGSGTVSGLTPGAIYEWRAQAHIGTYDTPWTNWIVQAQPNPNTSPGEYFDGSTEDRGDLMFDWVGAVDNSMSIAEGVAPEGWVFIGGGSGATAVLQRVTGGRTGGFGARVMFLTDATGPESRVGQSPTARSDVAEGGTYIASMFVNLPRPQRLGMRITWFDAGGVAISSDFGTGTIVAPDDWARVVTSGVAPAGAASAEIHLRDMAGDGHSPWLSGESFLVDAAMLTISELFPYFDGNTPPSAQYAYMWLGDANESVSQRFTLDLSDFDPLADPDCPPPPAAPQPPMIVDDCIDAVGVWRRYWAVIPEAEVSEWLAVVPTITITTGTLAARQVRVRAYPNPDGVNPEDIEPSSWESEQIVSYIPPDAVITLDGVAQRVFADVAGQHVSADRLLYGSGGGPASWPVLSCGVGYLLAFDVPIDAPDGNVAIDVALTTRTM